MKTRYLLNGLFLTVMLMISASLTAGTYSGGSGTEATPYQIADTDDLIELSNTSGDWNAYLSKPLTLLLMPMKRTWTGMGMARPTGMQKIRKVFLRLETAPNLPAPMMARVI